MVEETVLDSQGLTTQARIFLQIEISKLLPRLTAAGTLPAVLQNIKELGLAIQVSENEDYAFPSEEQERAFRALEYGSSAMQVPKFGLGSRLTEHLREAVDVEAVDIEI